MPASMRSTGSSVWVFPDRPKKRGKRRCSYKLCNAQGGGLIQDLGGLGAACKIASDALHHWSKGKPAAPWQIAVIRDGNLTITIHRNLL